MKKRSASLWSSLFVMTATMFITVSFSGFSFAGEADGKASDQNPAPGPSFDCSKVKTEVEKLICGSAELSKMDLELSEIYSQFTSGLGEPEKASLKKEQIEWIKGRSKRIEEGIMPADKPEDVLKKKEANLKKEYESRIAAIKAQLNKQSRKDTVADTGKISVSQSPAKPEALKETINSEKSKDEKAAEPASQNQSAPPPPVKTEAEKAQRVKAILEKYPMVFDAQYSKGSPKFCKEFFEALKRADKSIEYIEPVLRTDDPNHQGLSAYHSCSDAEPGESIYNDIHLIGDRSFRLYLADLDGNPQNGLEEYLYAELDGKHLGLSSGESDGYSRLDIRECKIIDSIQVHAGDIVGAKGLVWKPDYLNAFIKYKGDYYIYDLFDSRNDPSKSFSYRLKIYVYQKTNKRFEPVNNCCWGQK